MAMEPIQSKQLLSLILPRQSVSSASQSSPQNIPFQAGNIYQALVVKGGTGEILLDIMGKNIFAATNRALDTGQQLSLQVQSTTPQVELKILDSSLPALLAGKLSALSTHQGTQEALASITPETVSSFSLKNEAAQIINFFRSLQGENHLPVAGEYVKQAMDKLGLGLEADLATGKISTQNLKNAVLELAAKAEPLRVLADKLLPLLGRSVPDTALPQHPLLAKNTQQILQSLRLFLQENPQPQNILEQKITDIARVLQGLTAVNTQEAVEKIASQAKELHTILTTARQASTDAGHLVQRLETFQLLQVRLDQTDTLFFPLFFPFLSEGYLLVDRDGLPSEGKDAKSMRLTLLLAVTGLGDMQVDLLQEQGGISIRFFLDSAEKARFMAEFEQELYQSFDSLPIRALSFNGGAKPPQQVLVQKAMQHQSSQSLLDTRI